MIPVTLYLIYSKRIKDKALQVIFFLLVLNVCIDASGLYLYFIDPGQNFIAYNIFSLVETLVLLYFFSICLQVKWKKQFIAVVMVAAISYWLPYFIIRGTKDYLDNYQIFENILILLGVIYYYYEQIIKLNATFVYNQPRFWVVTAYFLFVSGIFFLIIYIPTLSRGEQAGYYVLNYYFTIIRSILLSIAMIMKPRIQQGRNKMAAF